jgi:hypothetical protein
MNEVGVAEKDAVNTDIINAINSYKKIDPNENVPTLPELIKGKLILFRDDYSNNIPKEIIHGYRNPGNHKVLTSFWTALIPHLEIALDENIIKGKRTRKKIRGFINKYTSKTFQERDRTSPKDIKRANKIINLVLNKM